MKCVHYLSMLCILASPQLLFAAEPGEHRYTPKEQIVFSSATMRAFDHSGQAVIHRKMPDGSHVADHSGSMGNVTVARMGPDGVIETFCTTDETDARAWMAGEGGPKPVASINPPAMEK